MMDRMILVAGAGGFIGGHLVKSLLDVHHPSLIRAVDIKPLEDWDQVHAGVQNVDHANLGRRPVAYESVRDVKTVYNLACDMGGMGFIENNKKACMMSVLINTHLLEAAEMNRVQRYFYASSACVYNGHRQDSNDVVYLREEDAYPADAEDGYGWEKLFSERLCNHFAQETQMDVRVARFHNVYGPNGTWYGGREKAPAAICRKVLEAMQSPSREIEIWGDGTQKRSFMFIEDCLLGIHRICANDIPYPINLGTSETVTINQLVDVVEEIAGFKCVRKYNLGAPQGVRSRSSDNTLIKRDTGWEPSTPLRDGMERTFRWIQEEFNRCQS